MFLEDGLLWSADLRGVLVGFLAGSLFQWSIYNLITYRKQLNLIKNTRLRISANQSRAKILRYLNTEEAKLLGVQHDKGKMGK